MSKFDQEEFDALSDEERHETMMQVIANLFAERAPDFHFVCAIVKFPEEGDGDTAAIADVQYNTTEQVAFSIMQSSCMAIKAKAILDDTPRQTH